MFFNWKKNAKTNKQDPRAVILFVDDEVLDRKLIAKILFGQNYTVITAENGQEGLELAKRHVPDLILSDCHMPTMDGVTMFKKLKEDNRTADIPFVFLTSNDSPAHLIDCFDMGAENYLCKPINRKVITAQIDEILKEHLLKNQEPQ